MSAFPICPFKSGLLKNKASVAFSNSDLDGIDRLIITPVANTATAIKSPPARTEAAINLAFDMVGFDNVLTHWWGGMLACRGRSKHTGIMKLLLLAQLPQQLATEQ